MRLPSLSPSAQLGSRLTRGEPWSWENRYSRARSTVATGAATLASLTGEASWPPRGARQRPPPSLSSQSRSQLFGSPGGWAARYLPSRGRESFCNDKRTSCRLQSQREDLLVLRRVIPRPEGRHGWELDNDGARVLHLPLNHFRFLVEGQGPSLMRLDGGTSHCHILIEQPSILDFPLYDHINGHSILLRLGLGRSITARFLKSVFLGRCVRCPVPFDPQPPTRRATPARRKRWTLPSCRPFLCEQSPPVRMSSPGSPPSRAAADPLLEPCRADARVGVSWLEADFIQRRAVVAGLRVGDHRPFVPARGQGLAHERGDRQGLRPGHLPYAVGGRPHGDVGQGSCHVIRRQGLHRGAREPDRVGAGPGDRAEELEELRGAEDRVGNLGGLDQTFLGDLRPHVAAVRKAVGPHYRQRDVVLHAGGRFRGEDVAGGFLEELQNRLVLERGRVRHVDGDVSAGERFGQPLACEGVDARRGRSRHGLVPGPAEQGDQFLANEPAAADHYDLHAWSPRMSPSWVGAHLPVAFISFRG